MLKEGLEPSRSLEQQILSLPWLPLHHSSILTALGGQIQGLRKFNTAVHGGKSRGVSFPSLPLKPREPPYFNQLLKSDTISSKTTILRGAK